MNQKGSVISSSLSKPPHHTRPRCFALAEALRRKMRARGMHESQLDGVGAERIARYTPPTRHVLTLELTVFAGVARGAVTCVGPVSWDPIARSSVQTWLWHTGIWNGTPRCYTLYIGYWVIYFKIVFSSVLCNELSCSSFYIPFAVRTYRIAF